MNTESEMRPDNNAAPDAVGRLIIARLEGTATAEENAALQAWIDASPENKRCYAQFKAVNSALASVPGQDVDKAWRRIRAKRRARLFYVAGACAVLLLGLFIWSRIPVSPASLPVHTVANIDNPSMHVELPDGTEVWMRPGSRLEYDDNFNQSSREIRLTGEAYFDVVRNPAAPFTVRARDFNIRVLGTVFNVKSTPDGPSEVTLAKGSVSVLDASDNSIFRLKPGQKATWQPSERVFDISEASTLDILFVRYGVVSMTDATLDQIISGIESEFGITVTVSGSPASSAPHHYNFTFLRDASPRDVLEQLQFLCDGYEFSIE